MKEVKARVKELSLTRHLKCEHGQRHTGMYNSKESRSQTNRLSEVGPSPVCMSQQIYCTL